MTLFSMILCVSHVFQGCSAGDFLSFISIYSLCFILLRPSVVDRIICLGVLLD